MWSFDPVTQIAFTVGFVYAFNERSDRIGLWDTIRQLSNSSTLRNSPWVIMGDFNQVLSVSEMYSLYPVDICVAGMMEFQECLNDSYLYDLSYQGCFFTWTNCSPSDPKSRKLDRTLINEAFQDKFPSANAVFDSLGSSDHSPCLVTISQDSHLRRSRFMFFPFFYEHPDYRRLLSEGWSSSGLGGSPMSSLYQKMRIAKGICKSLNRSAFSDIEKKR